MPVQNPKPSPLDPFPLLAETARIRSERRIARMAASMKRAHRDYEAPDQALGIAHIRATYAEHDELLRFVRSILANDFEGKECPGNCTHLDELGYEYDEPHLMKLDAAQVADIHLSIVDAAGDVLDELGLARAEA